MPCHAAPWELHNAWPAGQPERAGWSKGLIVQITMVIIMMIMIIIVIRRLVLSKTQTLDSPPKHWHHQEKKAWDQTLSDEVPHLRTVGLHNFNLQIFNLRVSNWNKLIVDVLLTRCRISMGQGLGPKKTR